MVTFRHKVSFAFSMVPGGSQYMLTKERIQPRVSFESPEPSRALFSWMQEHSPRDFIFGEPSVRRESSRGGLPEDAMMLWLVPTV